MIFVFRVACQPGLGHLMRMRWLSNALRKEGQTCVFVLCPDSSNFIPLLKEFVEEAHVLPNDNDESTDAANTISILSQYDGVEKVVIDHPLLGIEWEKEILAAGYSLSAFDDMARPHVADMVFDQKWQGNETAHRYEGQVAGNTKLFLGPDYCILGPDYSSLNSESVASDKATSKRFNVLLSLGGGGDLRRFIVFLRCLNEAGQDSKFSFRIVVGPQAEGAEELKALAQDNQDIRLLIGKTSLYEDYLWADLFIGALGTSLYELAATSTPGLTFSIARDQANRLDDLADFGHYLHLHEPPDLGSEQFVKLVLALSDQTQRLKSLCKTGRIKVDGLGAERVAAILMNQKAKAGVSVSLKESHTEYLKTFVPDFGIRKVKDSDLHAYRNARNLPNNTERFTVTSEVPLVEHYRWWFTNQRESYFLCQDGKPVLVVWQQVYAQGDKCYFYGGWFTAVEKVTFNIPMLALGWQLEETQSRDPHAHWVAVIHKDNRFVNLLNQYMGFHSIEDPLTLEVTKKLFPYAQDGSFNFVEHQAWVETGQ